MIFGERKLEFERKKANSVSLEFFGPATPKRRTVEGQPRHVPSRYDKSTPGRWTQPTNLTTTTKITHDTRLLLLLPPPSSLPLPPFPPPPLTSPYKPSRTPTKAPPYPSENHSSSLLVSRFFSLPPASADYLLPPSDRHPRTSERQVSFAFPCPKTDDTGC